ncbi:MAG TPA: hypothetical protein VFY89_06080, partial [Ktedonobacterales bacterium]
GDEEARRRGTQKTVLERKAPPTFDVLIEQEGRHIVAVHLDVASAVDDLLRGEAPERQMRERQPDGSIRRWYESAPRAAHADSVGLPMREAPVTRAETGRRRTPRGGVMVGQPNRPPWWEERRSRQRSASRPTEAAGAMRWLDPELALSAALVEQRDAADEELPAELETGVFRKRRIYPMGVSRNRLEQAIRELGLPAVLSREEADADALFVLKSMYRKQPDRVDAAQADGMPVYLLRSASLERLREALADLFQGDLGEGQRILPEPPIPDESAESADR